MKKILLIIAIVLCIFQMVVLATAIDIGSAATDRPSSVGDRTLIEAANPANASGILTSVEIYVAVAMTGVEIATFYSTGTNQFSTRDYVTIGNATVGHHQYDVELDVEVGDYLGMFFVTGELDRNSDAGTFYWYDNTDPRDQIPCTDAVFYKTSGETYTNSLYGTGVTGIKWNGVTITKWNGITVTKINGK